MDVSIKMIEFDEGCDLKSTAYLVKDLDVLIGPFGNGLGSGLFMKNNSIVISIASRWYNEDWYIWTSTAIGRRIYNFECNSLKCQDNDSLLLENILKKYNINLNNIEFNRVLNEQNPIDVLSKYIPNEEWKVIEEYHKDVSRKIDIELFIPFLKDILKNHFNNTNYVDLCRNNLCCNNCDGQLNRNVFGENNAW